MSASDFITLAGGLTVPLEPLMLALDLEARGFHMFAEGEDLLVQPAARLTPEDIASLKRWKRHVLAILAYEPPTHIN